MNPVVLGCFMEKLVFARKYVVIFIL